jgi:glucose/mannose-6-phosphate isomerase
MGRVDVTLLGPAALDSPDLAEVDPREMIGFVESLPAQWESAAEIAQQAPLPQVDPASVRAVVIVGMGGSGISGDVAAQLAATHSRVPVVTVKGASIPRVVGPGTLLVAVSFSGGTAETLTCYEQAGEAGADRYVVTSGGRLLDRAEQEGVPVARIPGEGQPRANLANLAVPVILGLERSGVLMEGAASGPLAEIPDHLRQAVSLWSLATPLERNEAKQVALEIGDRIPIFYGGRGWPALAALRGKCQVNENAERPAFWNEVPELDHNEIVGWSGDRVGEIFQVVALRSDDDEDELTARTFDATLELIAETVPVRRVGVTGPSALTRFATAAAFVDLVSVYLAYLHGIDPTPVESIVELKGRLAGAG